MRAMVAIGALLCLWCGGAGAEVAGTARALDGATLEIGGKRVALYGVEAPPAAQVCREWAPQGQREYRCGALARAFLQSLVGPYEVICVEEGPAQDGLVLATCFADGRDVGLAVIRAGWGLAAQPESSRYVNAEQGARQGRGGLWAGSSADPDQWRRARGAAR